MFLLWHWQLQKNSAFSLSQQPHNPWLFSSLYHCYLFKDPLGPHHSQMQKKTMVASPILWEYVMIKDASPNLLSKEGLGPRCREYGQQTVSSCQPPLSQSQTQWAVLPEVTHTAGWSIPNEEQGGGRERPSHFSQSRKLTGNSCSKASHEVGQGCITDLSYPILFLPSFLSKILNP